MGLLACQGAAHHNHPTQNRLSHLASPILPSPTRPSFSWSVQPSRFHPADSTWRVLGVTRLCFSALSCNKVVVVLLLEYKPEVGPTSTVPAEHLGRDCLGASAHLHPWSCLFGSCNTVCWQRAFPPASDCLPPLSSIGLVACKTPSKAPLRARESSLPFPSCLSLHSACSLAAPSPHFARTKLQQTMCALHLPAPVLACLAIWSPACLSHLPVALLGQFDEPPVFSQFLMPRPARACR
jgi:hypothetical protein